jgi:hypothetical protein
VVFRSVEIAANKIPACGTWEQAHNTALEFASEMGIAFTILVIAGSFVFLLL